MDYQRKVVVKNSGGDKKGELYEVNEEGDWQLLLTEKEGTFKELSKILRKKGQIPTNVVINKKGETFFN